MDLSGVQLPGDLLYVLGALILLVGLTWATYRYHMRNRRNDGPAEATVPNAYNRPESYGLRGEAPKRNVGPS